MTLKNNSLKLFSILILIIGLIVYPGLSVYGRDFTLHGNIGMNYFTQSRNLDKKLDLYNGYFNLKMLLKIGDNISFINEERMISEDMSRNLDNEMDVREAYFSLSYGRSNFRLGKQIITWGRTDRVNPTDNLTPWDYTLLLPEYDDLRLGRISLKADYNLGQFNLSGVWLPYFRPNKVPVNFASNIKVGEELPDEKIENSGYALKLDYFGNEFDGSISYLTDYSLHPDLILKESKIIDPTLPPEVKINREYSKIKVYGADFAKTYKEYGFRGEMAYFSTEDKKGVNPEIKNPFFIYVIGVDRTFLENLYFNLQYIQKRVINYEDPEKIIDPIRKNVVVQSLLINDQIDEIQNSISFKLSDKWLNEDLEIEINSIYNFKNKDYTVQPKIIYKFTSNIKTTFGVDIFQGEDESPFGRLKDNTTTYIDFKYIF